MTAPATRERPCRLVVVSPLRVVVHGVTHLLDPHRDRVVVGDDVDRADVILFDSWALDGDAEGESVDRVLAGGGHVLVLSHDLRPDLAARALAHGALAAVPLGVSAEELVRAVRATCGAHADAPHLPRPLERGAARNGVDALSPREHDVLRLICRGMSNQEIAAALYLSINSVKTYIRAAYRRIGVRSRPQAVVWCLQHGFDTGPGAGASTAEVGEG